MDSIQNVRFISYKTLSVSAKVEAISFVFIHSSTTPIHQEASNTGTYRNQVASQTEGTGSYKFLVVSLRWHSHN